VERPHESARPLPSDRDRIWARRHAAVHGACGCWPADGDFRILRTNLIEKGSATTENRFVPYTVFIDPQLGRVGITETQARAQNKKFRVAKMPMNYVARALEVDETRGFMKAIVDAESNQILGAAVLGIEGGEIMAMLQLAMMGRLPFTTLRDATFAHPTLAESLNNLFTHFA
jgi:pyruvate/2-oxoglutarate dehydrogenase complex dihydrolipoamide dehydrogenase (E3) component